MDSERLKAMVADDPAFMHLVDWRDLHEMAKELLELREELACLQWQPIESAPKDGTHILAARFDPFSAGFGWFNGEHVHYQDVVHYWSKKGEEGFYASNGPDVPLHFTHWMPLPNPPKEVNCEN